MVDDEVVSGLLLRIGRGDRTALEELVDRLYELVSLRARSMRPEVEVPETVVGTFLRVWHQAPGYSPGNQGPVSWVLTQLTTDPHHALI
jgi:DNA-directed RNA polymerase specialized sigma24 family protein